MKRMLSLLLCLVMLLGFAVPSVQASDSDDIYVSDGSLDNIIVGDNVIMDNVVIDGNSVTTTETTLPSPTDLVTESTEPITSPVFAETETAPVDEGCKCVDLASAEEHSGVCLVKAEYNQLCAGTAAELFDCWDSFSELEQKYILGYLGKNFALKYDELQKLLSAPAGSATETLLDGNTVSVEGIPEDGTLTVQEASDDAQDIVDAFVAEKRGQATELFTYDVSVQDSEGTDWQPDTTVKMELEIPGVTLHKYAKVYIVHVDDNGEATTIEAQVTEGGKVVFETPGFSTFAGFTVDFEFEGTRFCIPGLSSTTLSTLFEEMEIPLFISDVVNVEFSNYDLISVEKQEDGDWLLTSLQAFQTTETLTLTMNDGKVYEVTVTDAIEAPTISYNSSGNLDGGTLGVVEWYLTDVSSGIAYSTATGSNYAPGWTENYDIYIDGTGATNKTFEIVLQRHSSATGTELYVDLHTIQVKGGANLVFRFGSSITNENTEKVRIRQVRGYKTDAYGSDWWFGELFWIVDGSLDLQVPYTQEGGVHVGVLMRLTVDVDNLDNPTGNGAKALVSLRKNADYFKANQVHFHRSHTSAIVCRADNLSEFTMKDCRFASDCYAESGQGGAIYIHNQVEDSDTTKVDIANMTLDNVEFYKNEAKGGRGGAVLIRGNINTALTVKNCTFDQNASTSHGGAIEISNNDSAINIGSATFSNCTFNKTKATKNRGGAIRAVFSNEAPVTISGCTFTGCTAGSHGGAVSFQGKLGNFTVSNSKFTSGTAGARGGAIAVNCSKMGNLKLENSEFTGCSASTLGGAVEFGNSDSSTPLSAGTVDVTGCTFKNNSAKGVGGGLCLTDGEYKSVTITSSSFENCDTTGYGGGIGMKVQADNLSDTMPFSVDGNITITGCTFQKCDAGALAPNAYTDDAKTVPATWDHDGDSSTAEIDELNGASGGGAMAFGGPVSGKIRITGNSASDYTLIQNCTSWNNGGAIFFVSGLTVAGVTDDDGVKEGVTLRYLDIDKCFARDAGGAAYFGNVEMDPFLMTDCTVQNCGYFDDADTNFAALGFTIEDKMFSTPNVYTTVDGVKKVDTEATATLRNTLLTRWKAYGSGLYKSTEVSGTFRSVGNSAVVATISNCAFYKNRSYCHGGGVYWNANRVIMNEAKTAPILYPSLTIKNTIFDGNWTSRDGGGIFVEATVTIQSCEFKNNEAGNRGGALAQQVYNNIARQLGESGGDEATNVILMANPDTPTVPTTIHNNTATHGGGISITVSDTISVADDATVIYPVKFSLGGSHVYSNTATRNGGGIYYASTTYEDEVKQRKIDNFEKEILIDNGLIYGNTAGSADSDYSGSGGGIYMSSNQVNTASTIPEGEKTGYSKVTITGGSIYDNSATKGNGGGIHLEGINALCDVEGGVIGATANADGTPNESKPNSCTVGDIQVQVTAEDGTVTTETQSSGGNGGGISVFGGARIVMTGGYVVNNTSNVAGGGIAVHDGATMYISSGNIRNNSSSIGGGISLNGATGDSSATEDEYKYGMLFDGGYVCDNSVTPSASNNNFALGGGICISNASTMKLDKNAEISGNIASTDGTDAAFTLSQEGGGIAVCQGAQMDIYGGTIKNNEAYSGGGLVVRGGSILNMYPAANTGGEDTVGLITDNKGHGNGGGLSINPGSKVTIYGGNILNNEALAGGGVWAQGYNNETPGAYTTKLSVYGGSISYNKATGTGMYNGQGGGIHSDRCVDILISDSDTSDDVGIISYNEAYKGGGIYVCYGACLTVKNGHLVYNKALGSNSISTANKQNHGLAGVGGGVYVADGYSETNPAVFTLEGSDIAIYGNTATNAADDVFANGIKTKLNLPLVGSMNLSGYPLPAVGWVEDYPTNDTEYESGLNHGAEKGIKNGTNVYRYTNATAYYRILVPEKTSSGATVTLADFSPNKANTYVALTLGVPSAMPDAIVIDYGLPVKIDVKSNDIGLSGNVTTIDRVGALRPLATGGNVDMTEGSLDSNWSAATGCSYGTVTVDGQYVVYTPKTLIMDGKDEFSYALKYTQSGGDSFYFYSSVTVIPATSIYYEDNFTESDGTLAIDYSVYTLTTDSKGNVTESLNTSTDAGVQWAPEGGGTSQMYQEEDRPGIQGGTDHNNVYGYDDAYDQTWAYYSLDQTMKVTVNETKSAKAKFTFKGRGFDILAVTNNVSGTIVVTVDRLDDSSVANKYYAVNTYYGYTYDSENNKWTVDTTFDSGAHLYQIPVMSVDNLDYGEYSVEIYLAYDELFDHRKLGYYSFYLDAIRIYDSATMTNSNGTTMVEDTTIRDAYIADGEYMPTYYEVRDLLLDADKLSSLSSDTVNGAVFIDGIDTVTSAQMIHYQHSGPNNEVYLGRGQAIAFDMNFSGNVAAVHLGMKRVLDASAVKIYTIEDGEAVEFMTKTLNSTSELYFDISSLNGKTVIIENTATDTTKDYIISLTNLKVTSSASGTVSGEIPVQINSNTAAIALSYLNAAEPTITLKYPTVAFESEINYNIYYSVEGADVAVEDMGLITFDSELTDGTIDDATTVIAGASVEDGLYMVRSNGIAAKKLGEKLYFKVYIKLADGSYVYSPLAGYSALDYANSVLANAASSAELKSLVVAMLNYGAEAQTFFGYTSGGLMNAGLTDGQKAGISAYSADMLSAVQSVDAAKAVNFVDNGGFTKKYPNISFEGAFAINYFFAPAHAVDADVTMYYWDLDTYNSVDALTVDNASGSVKAVLGENGEYAASYDGIAAKDIDETVYVAVVYESEGVTYSSNVLAYSIGAYCADGAANDGSAMQALAKATAVYSWYAKSYFANV